MEEDDLPTPASQEGQAEPQPPTPLNDGPGLELPSTQPPAQEEEVPASQGRHSAGYAVDSRGRIVPAARGQAYTCPVDHLPSKTPQDTVRYASGGDMSAFVKLAARLLHPQGDATSGAVQATNLVARLTDTATVCQPQPPCPPTPSDLDAWDCSSHLRHIQQLLAAASRVTMLAQYHIGGFLARTTSSVTSTQERSEILVAIANAACVEHGSHYRATLAACGCEACTQALRWVQAGRQGPSMPPCRESEVVTKFGKDMLVNMTPTFFRQCLQMFAAMPATHPLLTSTIERPGISPTHARLLVVELQRAVLLLQRTPLPLPLGRLGLWAAFQVDGRHEEAVDWVDGDGGYLVVCHLPGMLEWVRRRAPTIVWDDGMRGNLIPFRCHAHDAIELDHIYHATGQVMHLGYQALCAARRTVAEAARIIVYTGGETDASGHRLICDIMVVNESGTATSTGEVLLRAGLSYPLPRAPTTFREAFAEAEASHSGVFRVLPADLATSAGVQPVALRAQFQASRHSITFHHQGERYLVTDRSAMRHTSHGIIWTSSLANAGQGCFVRSHSPHHQVRIFVRKGEILCGYGSQNITARELDSLPAEELEYALTVRRRWHYNAYVYNGENMGRYLNQGGLGEALAVMVRLAAEGSSPRFSLVEEEAERHCNAAFSYSSGHGGVVVAAHDLQLGSTPIELFVNYGIECYWVPFLARHAPDWGLQHPMVRAVLWCATSSRSCWPQRLRHVVYDQLPAGVAVPQNLSRPQLP